MIDYFAVNMCIQNWDGFWNNYYAYQSPPPGGKWELIPWDEDKTWGYFDSGNRRDDWYEMPLDFGMIGNSRGWGGRFGGGPFGGPSGWRPPGHFSGPLLANPEFRRRFLLRLREVCETVFTTERMAPFIDGLQNRLEEEVAFSANLRGQDPTFALKQFHADLQALRNQVVHRREFILKELANDPLLK
jgi:spore coat protein CotH